MTLAVEAEGLTKRYGQRLAVDRLNLAIRSGGICGFLGPNGSGKTTTLRMLLGLIRPSAGTVRLLGEPVQERGRLCQRVGAVIETPAFYPYLTGRENLRVLAGVGIAKVEQARLETLLERVGLASRAGDPVGRYSMGMKQRLGLAAALIDDPELLILDEPTNGLDPAGIHELRLMLSALRQEGRTILFSSHQLSEVAQLCTEVVIIHRGVLKLAATAEELQRGGERVVFRADPIARCVEVLQSLPGLEVRQEPEAVSVNGDAEVPALVRALVQQGVDIRGITREAPSLERQFFALTEER